jgi:hypothetical protein
MRAAQRCRPMKRTLRLGGTALALTAVWLTSCADDQRQPDGIGPCIGTSGTTSQGGDDSGGSGSSTGGSSNTGGASANGGSGDRGGTGGTSNGADGGDAPMGSCDLPWSEPIDTSECDLDALTPGDITLTGRMDQDLTLTTGHSYELDGDTRILPGRTLTIEPCVKIVGQSPESILAILPGARIEAEGREDAPIVFTSSKSKGSRRSGDWGGLMILGNARSNLALDENTLPQCEGLVDALPFGSPNDDHNDESSGTLAYVRVEYVGRVIVMNNESNGITFCGVGSGTTLHHVMVSNSIDDCFEWFGGTVNADHLVALNCDDDMFDTDQGFSGTIQYAFGRAFQVSPEDDNSNGFEMDTQATNQTATPRTSARWSNVTLCGGEGATMTLPRMGMVLRRGVSGSITNTLVHGWNVGISVRDPTTTNITLTHSAFWDNPLLYEPGAHMGGNMWLENQEGNTTTFLEGLCDCRANPPNPFPLAAISGGPTNEFPDDDAEFKGAFRDATVESNWMRGAWVDWAEE